VSQTIQVMQNTAHAKAQALTNKMDSDELFLDADMEQIENMRESRKKLKDEDFAKLINKKDLSDFELDEMFM